MKYTVSRMKMGLRIAIFGIVFFGLFLGGVIFLYLTGSEKYGIDRYSFILMTAVFSFFILLCVVLILASIRPRIEVDGEKVVYFPPWKKKRGIDITLIDRRKVTQKIDNTAMSFGAVGYMMTGGKSGIIHNYFYYINGKEVMKCSSDMKNAEKLDDMIKKQLPSEEE